MCAGCIRGEYKLCTGYLRGMQRVYKECTCFSKSVSNLVSKVWCRVAFDQSELSITRIPPTASPKVRPDRHR